MNLSPEEIDWIAEHGCIHGMHPDVPPIFCPVCKPDPTELWKKVSDRYALLTEGEREKPVPLTVVERVSARYESLTKGDDSE